jgi:thioredoxin reductase (NADPH)
MTNIPGLFAAGDVNGGKLQIAKAVYDGMNAADAIYNYNHKK